MKRYLLSRNIACLGGLLVVIVVGGLMFAFGEGGPKQALVAPVLWLAHPTLRRPGKSSGSSRQPWKAIGVCSMSMADYKPRSNGATS